MHVLHIDEQNGWRGGEQQASWLIRGLLAQGVQVSLAGRPDSLFLTADHGGEVMSRNAFSFRGEADLISAWRLAAIVRETEADILHAHTSLSHTMAVLARRIAGRGKVVVSRRVSFPPHTDPVNRWKYRQPDFILAVSEHVASVLKQAGIPENLIRVVHSSVDPGRLEASALPRSTFGIPEGAPLLVNAGALVGHKDHENLLRAMSLLLEAYPDAHLIIAGEGPLRPGIEKLIRELNLGEAVSLAGHRKDAPRIIRMGDVYVSSSWSEGLGTSILEALTCGVPVTATRAGGAAEMIRPGETGILVPPRDPEALARGIISSLRDREKTFAMAEAGKRLIAEQFVTDRMVEKTLAVYNEALSN